ncbi:Cyclin-dependent kinase catalytic subunit, partial [Massospora cicadina]
MNRVVALKKMGYQGTQDDGEDGISATTLREISLLKELKHDNIISLLATHYEKTKLLLVFEYLDVDLKKYLEISRRNDTVRVDALKIMFHLLTATEYLHSKGVVHRDIKPQNILIDKYRRVKLADFGLARYYSLPAVTMTHEVVPLWYRAPEVLLGVKRYTAAVDIWSLGCIFAELCNRRPLFCGDLEVDQLFRIFQILGTPTPETCPFLCSLKQYNIKMPQWKKVDLSLSCPNMSSLELDLLKRMLEPEPHNRLSARRALSHPVFSKFYSQKAVDDP